MMVGARRYSGMEPGLALILIPTIITIGSLRIVAAMATTCCDIAASMMLFIPLSRSGSGALHPGFYGSWPVAEPWGQVLPFRKRR
jgi:hypothetical protein